MNRPNTALPVREGVLPRKEEKDGEVGEEGGEEEEEENHQHTNVGQHTAQTPQESSSSAPATSAGSFPTKHHPPHLNDRRGGGEDHIRLQQQQQQQRNPYFLSSSSSMEQPSVSTKATIDQGSENDSFPQLLLQSQQKQQAPAAPTPATTSHHFHSFYDSDGSDRSDGSLVLNVSPTASMTSPQQMSFPPSSPSDNNNNNSIPRWWSGAGNRDRFPSFDSTGSFRVLPNQPQMPSPVFTTPQPQPPRLPPHLLPYDQRRKLQQQQQQQQLNQGHLPQAPKPQPQRAQYVVPSPHQPPPPQQPILVPQFPPTTASMQDNNKPYNNNDPFNAPYPMFSHHLPLQQLLGQQQQQQQQQHHHYPQQQLSSSPNGYPRHVPTPSLSPSPRKRGISMRSFAAAATAGATPPVVLQSRKGGGIPLPLRVRSRTSSTDSSPDKHQQHPDLLPPPPPPLPPPPPPSHPPPHVRSESGGSVSSLGSPTQYFSYTEDSSDGGGGGMDSWPVHNSHSKSSVTRHAAAIEEFHQRSQAFLQQEQRRQSWRSLPQATPPQQRHNRRASPRSLSGSSTGGTPQQRYRQTPPTVRGSHRHLQSIQGDNWDDNDEEEVIMMERRARSRRRSQQQQQQQQQQQWDQQQRRTRVQDDEDDHHQAEPTETSQLLPPSGIATGEYTNETRPVVPQPPNAEDGRTRTTKKQKRRRKDRRTGRSRRSRHRYAGDEEETDDDDRRRRQRRRFERDDAEYDMEDDEDDSYVSSSTSSSSNFDYRQWTKKRARMLARERAKFIAQWKAEAEAEAELERKQRDANRWHRRVGRQAEHFYLDKLLPFVMLLETFFSNLPLTTGAVALSVVTLGVVWFKFTEMNLSSCHPVDFHSDKCTFPEFPGCFDCNTSDSTYEIAVSFLYTCSSFAGILIGCLIIKVILALRSVVDELSSPTTSSPAGLVCMTTVVVGAGQGFIGQVLVSGAAAMHFCLAIWFIYMALAYNILPDPSWYPNTVGLALTAIKTWLYYPSVGTFLMAISLALLFLFFPISVIRVTLNKKISAPVCWIQASAPALSLYAFTVVAQPTIELSKAGMDKFDRLNRIVYMPCMHFLFGLTMIGISSSVQSLVFRWKSFCRKQFSPAHMAFCFPTLAHANAVQSYLAALNSFTSLPDRGGYKSVIYWYWVVVLSCGSLVTLVFMMFFFYHLPSWTNIDVADEEEPPAPFETEINKADAITAGDALKQDFVSPAVLQANETGQLVVVAEGRRGHRYVRTRRLPALGFVPTMNWSEMTHEREVLLDWVGKNPPRRRKRTLSVPGMDFNYGYGDFGMGNEGVYGRESPGHGRHSRVASAIQPSFSTRTRINTDDLPAPWQYSNP